MALPFCVQCLARPTVICSSGLVLLMASSPKILLALVVLIMTCGIVVLRVSWVYNDLKQPAEPELIHSEIVLNNDDANLCRPPLRTKGRHVVNQDGSRCKLASINWYGASDEHCVTGGLDIQHRDDIARTIRKLGFNSVRLPYADEMVRGNPMISFEHLAANPDLMGFKALDVFEAVVKALTGAGLAVIINNHITSARWCCDGDLCDAKWSNSYLGPLCRVRQTEEDWIANLETVMRPHIHDSLVIGVDLRNEPRGPSGRLLWSSWAKAAERAGDRLHHLQSAWLIMVEGVASANDLSGARSRPVRLRVSNKLVYSAHVYGWSGWGSLRPYWGRDYASFSKDMDRNWAYLLKDDIAPVWVGEFGAPDAPNKGDMNYWKNLVRFLHENDVDFGYWPLNPRKPKDNESDTYGLVKDDWQTIQYDYRLADLTELVPPRSPPFSSSKPSQKL